MTSEIPNVTDSGRYTVCDAARIMNVNRRTIYNWIDKGYLKFGLFRHNGRKFIPGKELIRFWKAIY